MSTSGFGFDLVVELAQKCLATPVALVVTPHKKAASMDEEIEISKAKLTAWAESLFHMNHHGTLVQREIQAGNYDRAAHLAERARKRAWQMLNELFGCGAEKPKGYCEPDTK